MTKAKNETPEQRERRLANNRKTGAKYRKSDAGKTHVKSYSKQYNASEAREATRQRYASTEHGAKAIAANNASRTTKRHEKQRTERAQGRSETRQQVRKEREGRQMARRHIVKPPRRPPYHGIRGYNTGGNAVSRQAYVQGIPTPWLTQEETASDKDLEKFFAFVWEGLTREEIIWGRAQIAAEQDYAKRLLAFRGSQRASRIRQAKRRAKAPSARRDVRDVRGSRQRKR